MTNTYTRTGDTGMTTDPTGGRITKASTTIEVVGLIDKACVACGYALSACPPSLQERFAPALERCIDNLFVCALPLKQESLSAETAWLEEEIDKMEAQLPALDSFIKPLGGEFSMRLHLARTDVRTLERALCETVFQTPDACAFINRLSDYLFVASRYVNHISGTPDVPEVFE